MSSCLGSTFRTVFLSLSLFLSLQFHAHRTVGRLREMSLYQVRGNTVHCILYTVHPLVSRRNGSELICYKKCQVGQINLNGVKVVDEAGF